MNSTRRQLLSTLAVSAGGIAGCLGGTSSSEGASESSTEGRPPNVPDDQSATDPPRVVRRSASTRPPIRHPEFEADDSETARSRVRSRHPTSRLIDSESTARQLVVDGDDSEISAFVSATEFDSETLYLQTNPVGDCFELSLCYVSWHDETIRTDYGRVVRPYEDRCSADTTVLESWLIRLPVALDADSISSFGSSTGSSRCHRAGSDRRSNGSRPAAENSSTTPNGSGSR